jgi:hypothetical protein
VCLDSGPYGNRGAELVFDLTVAAEATAGTTVKASAATREMNVMYSRFIDLTSFF